MQQPLDWVVSAGEVGEPGLRFARRATAEERVRLAAALEIVAVRTLDAACDIERQSGGRYRLQGRIRADVTQSCVVTLEPVDSTVEATIAVQFFPDGELPERAPVEREALSVEDQEALADDRIEIGRLIFEHLAAGLDPYPRKAGVEFTWRDDTEGGRNSPFAALARLREKK